MCTGCQAQLGDPSVPEAPSLSADSSAGLPPPLALSRSMPPLLTAENRARLPAPSPAPPAGCSVPRDPPEEREECAAEELHPGAGPAEGGRERPVWPQLSAGERGQEERKPKSSKSPLCAGRGGTRMKGPSPITSQREEAGLQELAAREAVGSGQSPGFWMGLWASGGLAQSSPASIPES